MISPTQYRFLSGRINEIQSIEDVSIDFVDSFEIKTNDLLSLNENVDDIKEEISRVETQMNSRLNQSYTISAFVGKLQQHILDNTIYDDINDYLRDFDIKVGSFFAAVSTRVGYTINDSNILGLYVDFIPNAIAWPPRTGNNLTEQLAVWQEYLDFGFNTLPTGVGSLLRNPIENQTDNIWIDQYLQAQEQLGGQPIQLKSEFGLETWWGGTSNGPVIYRDGDAGSTEDPGDPAHFENYHTHVESAILAGGAFGGFAAGTLEALATKNWPAVVSATNFRLAIIYNHCPNQKASSAYINALAKLNEYCKWLKPQVLHVDNEFYANLSVADWAILNLTLDAGGVSGCTRCGSEAGFITGQDAIATEWVNIARQYVKNPLVVQYAVYSRSDAYQASLSKWTYGSTTGLLVGNPSVYPLTYDNTGAVGSREVFSTNLVDRLLGYRDGTIPAEGWTPEPPPWSKPEAINGSYVYFSQRLDAYDASRGFLGPEEFYKICYYIASEGAYGFALWPGYSGKDKIPTSFTPHTPTYTTSEVNQDNAAKLLFAAGIQAFRDYFKLHTVQPLPIY